MTLWRITSKAWLLAVALAMCLVPSLKTDGDSSPQRAAPFARPVDSFRVQDTSLIETLLRLGQGAHLPFGIEYVDMEAVEQPITVNLHQVSIAHALGTILSKTKGYEWREEDGVIRITHKNAPSGSRNLLDRTLTDFRMPRITLQDASHLLWMELDRQLHPGIKGTAGDYSPAEENNLVGPIRMSAVTVRQVLNRLVRENGNAAWVVRVPPRDLDQLSPGGLWKIVEYEDTAIRNEVELSRQDLLKYRPHNPN